MIITAAEKLKNGYRIVTEERELILEKELFLLNFMEVGEDVSEALLLELENRSRLRFAVQRAMTFISFKRRTTQETRKKLLEAGFDKETASEAVEYLCENNLLDDESYVLDYIESKRHTHGSFYISGKLFQKGISKELLDNMDIPEEEEDILALLEKKWPNQTDFDLKLRSKMIKFAVGRGFSYENSKKAVQMFTSGEL